MSQRIDNIIDAGFQNFSMLKNGREPSFIQIPKEVYGIPMDIT
ncbi:hypothetical protein ACVNSY_18965 [Bacillus sp. OHL2]